MTLLFAVAVSVLAVATIVGGWVGLAYVFLYALATAPGWPIGRALFGKGHPAAWISGSILGYGLTAVAVWVPIALGMARWPVFVIAWSVALAITWFALRRRVDPLVIVPPWEPRATRALMLVLVLVLAVAALPYAHIGQQDSQGNRRYRAYFTADFVWHEALTAELARFSSPPRNPYMAAQPLHYYWTYFLLPAAVTGAAQPGLAPVPIEPFLKVNALCTGLLFVASIFLAAWAAVPRAVPVAIATALSLLASSAEGLYAAVDLLRHGRPLVALRNLNIDAITSWYFQGLTIDGLPRSIWYNPQHSMACALGLVALTLAARSGAAMRPMVAAGAGLALGLAVMMSPFPGAALTLVYAAALLWDALVHPRSLPRMIVVQMASVMPVAAALAWCVANRTFEGAGGALAFGISARARKEPFVVLGLALGPVLLPALAGVVVMARDRFPRAVRPAISGVTLALVLFYGVTLVVEPIWIGWRAGQVFLVTAPGLIAAAVAFAADRAGRVAVALITGAVLAVGLPTTLIDIYNAQDTSNDTMGPGFRWTVVVTPEEQQALQWIDRHTSFDAVVQMSLGPRGRETWTLIPSFARRRMAAGLPISLLRTPEYRCCRRQGRPYLCIRRS